MTNALLRRWPSALGLTAAVLVLIFAADRDTASTAVTVALLCYLGAAAFARPWVAWAGVAGFSVVVVAVELAGVPWWAAFVVVTVLLLGIGLATRAPRRALLAQTAAALAYGTPAVLALYLSPLAGAIVAGLALATHAAWDMVHFRRDTVVPRSLAEACMFLDVPLGIGVIVLAVSG
ncbi:hypothetical protein AB0F81_19770 [Actinoplanes sp. NPDC024001]|uniref:hypothetical protein n=1 Tax=Actinoplanes sp. NPDC024001 TaxID=3154598 RepID=UPI0033DDF5D5